MTTTDVPCGCCPVCMEESKPCFSFFECSHQLCGACFDRWWTERQERSNCPVCRQPLAGSRGSFALRGGGDSVELLFVMGALVSVLVSVMWMSAASWQQRLLWVSQALVLSLKALSLQCEEAVDRARLHFVSMYELLVNNTRRPDV